jgi:hypothetical protein
MNAQSYFRSPFAPRIHFDEAGAGGAGAGAGAGAGDGGAGAGAGAGAGGGAKPWFDGIDAETIGHWDNKGWKKDDPKALATELTKAWKGLERHFGTPADQLVKLPKDMNDEAGWSAVRQRLGMPKEAKEYDFSGVKFSDGTELDQGFTDTMRGALHKAGVSKDLAPEIVRSVVNFMDAADKADGESRAATLKTERASLEKEWGNNFEFNKLTAMQGAKRLGVDEATVAQLESTLGYAKVMEMFRRIGAGTNEDSFVEGGGSGNPTTLNGAKARIAELKSDQDWVKRYLSGSKKEVDEMNNLLMLANGIAA